MEVVAVEPGALLVTAPATTLIARLHEELAPYRLALPIFPLVPGLTLADLVACNAGGRRRFGYGTIGRYLRAAQLILPDGTNLSIGGPTIKRATGYGLHRALAASQLDLGIAHEFTFSLRPLPADRATTLLYCPSLAEACRLVAQLVHAGLALSALPVAEQPDGSGALLVELEGVPALLARQVGLLRKIAADTGATVMPVGEGDPWHQWYDLAAAHLHPAALRRDLTLPRDALPAFVARARTLAMRYHLPLTIWGDAGVGTLHLGLAMPTDEAEQLLRILQALATEAGGTSSTEMGMSIQGFEQDHMLAGLHESALRAWSPKAPLPDLALHERLVRQTGREQILTTLRSVVGETYLLTRKEDIACYDQDASIAQPLGQALAVALPATTSEVAGLMRAAATYGLPVVVRGAGSGLAGGSTPTAHALILGLNRLDQITLDKEQMVAHVGAGAITAEIQRAAETLGLFYPPDPSSQTASTIGGNLACNAGGPRCVKYGVTSDYVLAVTAVLADGTIVRWGDGLAGQGTEQSLAQLLVGSEGTLAVITEVTLRLVPLPPARRTTMALFAKLEDACATVEQIMASGLVPSALELMDDTTLAAVEAYLHLGLPPETGAMLLMLSDGEPETVAHDAEALAALARTGGARLVQVAQSASDEAKLWQARRAVSIALARIRPNRLGEDIAVPLTRIAESVRLIKALAEEHQLPIVVFGHAGDGNLHPNILFDARDPVESARIWPCAEAIFRIALAVDGTLSGEHGIGTLKLAFMHEALGATQLAVQHRIKASFDPGGRLNPGKVLPAP